MKIRTIPWHWVVWGGFLLSSSPPSCIFHMRHHSALAPPADGLNLTCHMTACQPRKNVTHLSPKTVLTAKYRSQFPTRIHYFLGITGGKIDCLIFAVLFCFSRSLRSIFCLQDVEVRLGESADKTHFLLSANDQIPCDGSRALIYRLCV